MGLHELQRLTNELEELMGLLRAESRPQARYVIIRRAREIMELIGKGVRE